MENSMEISHKFIEDKEGKDDQKCNAMNNAAVICVGSTGTGKSSLIKLFCGNDVKVGHSVKSETQGPSLFTESGSGRYWLDSQGANDSQGVDDEKVLTDVLKTLYDNNISNIKVIWCISGDFDRAKQEFQTQAKFIKSLGDEVWNSCLIVQKKGPIEPDDIDGVLEAARNKGANIEYGDNRLFGYTGIDYMTDADKQKDRLLRKILKQPDTEGRRRELSEEGYLNNKQIVEHVNERLAHLSSLKIIFTVKKCEKCGVKGDSRFVYAPCHTESEKYHPKEATPYHKGELEKVHIGTKQPYHPTPLINRVHTGSLTYYHPESWTTTYSTEYYHSESTFYYNFSKQHGLYNVRHSCCRNPQGHRGCKSREVRSSSYSCCDSTSSSGGCTGKYTCCNGSSGSTGCREEWECCKLERKNPGCQEKYGCCGGSVNSEGCREEWSCCNTPSDNPGCARKHKCCDKDEGKDGCKERCKSCNKEWGKGPGCIETTKVKNKA